MALSCFDGDRERLERRVRSRTRVVAFFGDSVSAGALPAGFAFGIATFPSMAAVRVRVAAAISSDGGRSVAVGLVARGEIGAVVTWAAMGKS